MSNIEDKAKALVEDFVLLNQNSLVEALLESSLVEWDNIINCEFYDHIETGISITVNEYNDMEPEEQQQYELTAAEVMQWLLVDEWLANKLLAKNQPMLIEYGCCWWGRCTYGQSISMDTVIEDIAKEMM